MNGLPGTTSMDLWSPFATSSQVAKAAETALRVAREASDVTRANWRVLDCAKAFVDTVERETRTELTMAALDALCEALFRQSKKVDDNDEDDNNDNDGAEGAQISSRPVMHPRDAGVIGQRAERARRGSMFALNEEISDPFYEGGKRLPAFLVALGEEGDSYGRLNAEPTFPSYYDRENVLDGFYMMIMPYVTDRYFSVGTRRLLAPFLSERRSAAAAADESTEPPSISLRKIATSLVNLRNGPFEGLNALYNMEEDVHPKIALLLAWYLWRACYDTFLDNLVANLRNLSQLGVDADGARKPYTLDDFKKVSLAPLYPSREEFDKEFGSARIGVAPNRPEDDPILNQWLNAEDTQAETFVSSYQNPTPDYFGRTVENLLTNARAECIFLDRILTELYTTTCHLLGSSDWMRNSSVVPPTTPMLDFLAGAGIGITRALVYTKLDERGEAIVDDAATKRREDAWGEWRMFINSGHHHERRQALNAAVDGVLTAVRSAIIAYEDGLNISKCADIAGRRAAGALVVDTARGHIGVTAAQGLISNILYSEIDAHRMLGFEQGKDVQLPPAASTRPSGIAPHPMAVIEFHRATWLLFSALVDPIAELLRGRKFAEDQCLYSMQDVAKGVTVFDSLAHAMQPGLVDDLDGGPVANSRAVYLPPRSFTEPPSAASGGRPQETATPEDLIKAGDLRHGKTFVANPIEVIAELYVRVCDGTLGRVPMQRTEEHAFVLTQLENELRSFAVMYANKKSFALKSAADMDPRLKVDIDRRMRACNQYMNKAWLFWSKTVQLSMRGGGDERSVADDVSVPVDFFYDWNVELMPAALKTLVNASATDMRDIFNLVGQTMLPQLSRLLRLIQDRVETQAADKMDQSRTNKYLCEHAPYQVLKSASARANRESDDEWSEPRVVRSRREVERDQLTAYQNLRVARGKCVRVDSRQITWCKNVSLLIPILTTMSLADLSADRVFDLSQGPLLEIVRYSNGGRRTRTEAARADEWADEMYAKAARRGLRVETSPVARDAYILSVEPVLYETREDVNLQLVVPADHPQFNKLLAHGLTDPHLCREFISALGATDPRIHTLMSCADTLRHQSVQLETYFIAASFDLFTDAKPEPVYDAESRETVAYKFFLRLSVYRTFDSVMQWKACQYARQLVNSGYAYRADALQLYEGAQLLNTGTSAFGDVAYAEPRMYRAWSQRCSWPCPVGQECSPKTPVKDAWVYVDPGTETDDLKEPEASYADMRLRAYKNKPVDREDVPWSYAFRSLTEIQKQWTTQFRRGVRTFSALESYSRSSEYPEPQF